MHPISIAIIGCGYWGPKLIRNFGALPEFKVVAVVDQNLERAQAQAQEFGVPAAFSSLQEAFAEAPIEAVAIATPISTHADLALAALNAGKHVLVEKPMAHSVEACQKMIQAAEANERVLMVDHTFLYTPSVRKLRELVDAGSFGDLYYYDSVRINLGLFQHDYNVIWDLAPHDVSIMRYLIDDPVTHVSAIGATPVQLQSNLESVAYISVRHASGILGHVHVNWLAPAKVRTVLLGGSKKMAIYDDTQFDEKVKIYDRGVDVGNKSEEYHARLQYRMGDVVSPRLDRIEALRSECLEFARCIRQDARPTSTAQLGLEVVQILEAADLSLKQNGAPIPLNQGEAQ